MARPPAPRSSDANGHGPAPVALAPNGVEASGTVLATLLADRFDDVLDAWVEAQIGSGAYRDGGVSEREVRAESSAILNALGTAVAREAAGGARAAGDAEVGTLLTSMSKDRARQGYSPSETALAVFSLKGSLGGALDETYRHDPERLAAETKILNGIVDGLGLQTFEAYVAGRAEVISGQQQSLLELSTPVVKLWDGIVAAPLIGTLDSGRTQLVMEGLLQSIVENEAQVAIVDITGVPMVDTLVAQHLLKTVAATRLMGAECIISGVRPQIAQTMVHLGVDLSEVVTKATLADAFRLALRRIGADPAATAAAGR